jgi:hypothetical protein
LTPLLRKLAPGKTTTRVVTFAILLPVLCPLQAAGQRSQPQSSQLYSFADSPDGADDHDYPLLYGNCQRVAAAWNFFSYRPKATAGLTV